VIGADSRRRSAGWGKAASPEQPVIDVLIPTADRGAELAVTLAGLAAQDSPAFRVTLSDQGDTPASREEPAVLAMIRVLRAQNREVRTLRHLPRHGIAEHRQFLLEAATAPFVLYLDDDVWLEPDALARLHAAILDLDCGFVGSAVQGLSFLDDERPDERAAFSPWNGRVTPERMRRDAEGFARWRLHNAANLVHLARDLGLGPDEWLAYRVAWIGGCVLYRREALVASGGFDFWEEVTERHSGEDVAAQWRVMERFGGAGILPSGAVHLEAPSTIPDREGEAFDVVFGRGPFTAAHLRQDPE